MQTDQKVAEIVGVIGCTAAVAHHVLMSHDEDIDAAVSYLLDIDWKTVEIESVGAGAFSAHNEADDDGHVKIDIDVLKLRNTENPTEFPDEEPQDCPLFSLPDELLLKIFGYVGGEAGHSDYDIATSGLRNASSYAKSCRRLRRIAYTERTWSSLYCSRFGARSAPKSMFVSRTDINFGALAHKLGAFAADALSFGRDSNNNDDDMELEGPSSASRRHSLTDVSHPIARKFPVRMKMIRDLRNVTQPYPGGIRRVTQHVRVPKPDAPWRSIYADKHRQQAYIHRMAEYENQRHREEARRYNRPHRRFGRWIRDDVMDDEPQDRVLQLLGLIMAAFPLAFFILLGIKLDGGISISYTVVFLPCWIGVGLFTCIGGIAAQDQDSIRHCRFGLEEFKMVGVGVGASLCASIVFFLFPIFVLLRIDGIVEWSWAVVFIPVFIFLLIPCVAPFIIIFNQDEDDWEDLFNVEGLGLVALCLMCFCLVAFGIMLPIYLDGVWQITMYELMIPIWIMAFLLFFPFVMLQWVLIIVYVVLVVPITVLFPLLLSLKIEGAVVMSWSVAFIPLYIFVGILTFGVCAAIVFKDDLGYLWSSD